MNYIADFGSKYFLTLGLRYILEMRAWSLIRLVLSLELVIHVFDYEISKWDLSHEDIVKVLRGELIFHVKS
jgi:hypothetical protein